MRTLRLFTTFLFILFQFSHLAFAEKNKIIERFGVTRKNTEIVEIVPGPVQDRSYQIVSKPGNKCRAETPTQWNENRRFQSLLRARKICEDLLQTKYTDLYYRNEAHCHQGIIYQSDSVDPLNEQRRFILNSKDSIDNCYIVYDPSYRGDYEYYFSAIIIEKK